MQRLIQLAIFYSGRVPLKNFILRAAATSRTLAAQPALNLGQGCRGRCH